MPDDTFPVEICVLGRFQVSTALGRASMAPVETVRCVVDSLAARIAETIDEAASLAARSVNVVHVVGGGSQNDLLCRLTADAVGRPVVAGPVEATALGNVLVQAWAHGALHGSPEDLRSTIHDCVELRRYEPA